MRRLGLCAATAALVAAATSATAATLDQSDVPETGFVGALNAGGSTVMLPTVTGQSFTTGRSGTLDRIDFAMFRLLPTGLGATFNLLYDSGASLFSEHFAPSAIPLLVLSSTDWSAAPSVDLTSLDLSVTAGDHFTFTLTPDAGDDPWTALLYFADNTSFSYAGGTIVVGDVPASVPELTTWVLMVLGFGAAGAALRRTKHRQSAVA